MRDYCGLPVKSCLSYLQQFAGQLFVQSRWVFQVSTEEGLSAEDAAKVKGFFECQDLKETWEKTGENGFKVSTSSPGNNHSMSFTLGKEFEMPSPDGKTMKLTVRMETPTKMVDTNDRYKISNSREVNGNEMVLKMQMKGLACTRRFTKQ